MSSLSLPLLEWPQYAVIPMTAYRERREVKIGMLTY